MNWGLTGAGGAEGGGGGVGAGEEEGGVGGSGGGQPAAQVRAVEDV